MTSKLNYKLIFNTLFSHLQTEKDATVSIQNLMKFPQVTDNDIQLVKLVYDKKTKLIKIISAALPEWTFYRLGQVEQMIVLVGATAIIANLDDKKRVIDVCLNYSHGVCEQQAYRVINKILDRIKPQKEIG